MRWFEYQYWMTDPLCLLLVVLALLLIRRERTWALGTVSVLAAFVRETYVLVYPYYFLRLLKRHGLREAALRTLAVAAAPAAILLLIRRLVPANPHESLFAEVSGNVDFRLRHFWENQLYLLTLGTWGVLVPLLFVYPRRLLRLARRHYDAATFVVLVYAVSFVTSNNTERPLAYALPFVLAAALWAAARLLEETGLAVGLVFAALLLAQAVLYRQTLFHEEMGTSIYQPTHPGVVAAMALVWLLARLALRRRPAARLAAPSA